MGESRNTVVVVDDDTTILLMIKRFLGDEGYQVLTAENGLQAQSLIKEHQADLVAVLTDWSMPIMNGIDLLRWMKTEGSLENIPVVMQTGMNRAQDIKEGIDAGAFYYLVKPFQKDVLKSIVRAAVSDFRYTDLLLKKVKETENVFKLLDAGKFHFRAPAEAESLSVQIANAAANPTKALIITELMLNAIEHGNLEITYQEKTEFIEKGTLREEIRRRLEIPEHINKQVVVSVARNLHDMVVEIADNGKGFDFHKFLEMDESRVFDNHGRGVAMVSAQFKVEYLERGNIVRVTVPTG